MLIATMPHVEVGERKALEREREYRWCRWRENGAARVQLHPVKGLMACAKEFEHFLEGSKGPLKAITWGLPLWEPDPEPCWRHEFLVTESQ